MKNAISTVFAIAAIGIAAMTLATCDLFQEAFGGGQTPIAADFEIGNLSQIAGSVTAVTITPKPGRSTGTIAIYYNRDKTIPQTAGLYAVTFDVAAAGEWNAASGLRAGTLTVSNQIENPQTPVAADFEIGNLSQIAGSVTAVTIRPRQDKSTGRVTIYYNGATTIPQTAGSYAVTFDVAVSFGWIAASGLSAGTLTVSSGGGDDGGGNGPVYTFNSIAEFSTWLAGQSTNTAATAYNVKLNVGDLGGEAATAGSVGSILNANSGKYVYLDLSGSTITNVPDLAFCAKRVVEEPGVTTTYYDGVVTLTGITLPDSLISIGERALSGCHGLTGIIIPDNVESIGNSAISNCTSLLNVTIGSGVTDFGEGVFWYCPFLADVTIKNGVTVIGNYAFWNCYSLTSVSIPDSVESIGYYVFGYCRDLVSVTIGSGVTSIERNIFFRCNNFDEIIIAPDNTAFSVENGVIYNKNKTTLVMYTSNKQGAFTIPNNVTVIGDWAFSECANLTGITIPNSVTSIGEGAFSLCANLENVIITDSVTSIGDYAFYRCNNLTSITIPNGVTSIGEGAFYRCENLTSVTIPDSVTNIEIEAFYECNKLVSVTLPNNADFTSIKNFTFYGCSLTSITIPDNVTSIGNGVFAGCDFTSITIPASVTSIGSYAFSGCSNLTSVTFAEGNTIASGNFGGGVFPEGSDGDGGNTLKNAYTAVFPRAGTFTRVANGSTWTKQ